MHVPGAVRLQAHGRDAARSQPAGGVRSGVARRILVARSLRVAGARAADSHAPRAGRRAAPAHPSRRVGVGAGARRVRHASRAASARLRRAGRPPPARAVRPVRRVDQGRRLVGRIAAAEHGVRPCPGEVVRRALQHRPRRPFLRRLLRRLGLAHARRHRVEPPLASPGVRCGPRHPVRPDQAHRDGRTGVRGDRRGAGAAHRARPRDHPGRHDRRRADGPPSFCRRPRHVGRSLGAREASRDPAPGRSHGRLPLHGAARTHRSGAGSRRPARSGAGAPQRARSRDRSGGRGRGVRPRASAAHRPTCGRRGSRYRRRPAAPAEARGAGAVRTEPSARLHALVAVRRRRAARARCDGRRRRPGAGAHDTRPRRVALARSCAGRLRRRRHAVGDRGGGVRVAAAAAARSRRRRPCGDLGRTSELP